MNSKNFNFPKETNFYEFDLKPFFDKIKLLNELEKASSKATQFEQDAAFIKALKSLLSESLQAKATEAIKMLPFFSMAPLLKKEKAV